jgi:hypothetical protein
MASTYYSKRLKFKLDKRINVRRERTRPKSFKTEAAAKKWAEENKVKSYELKNLKSSENSIKKLVIIEK